MANSKESYQVTGKDIADAEAMMTPAKQKSSEKRVQMDDDLVTLLEKRGMQKEELKRINLRLTETSGRKQLMGTIVDSDGVTHPIDVTYRYTAGGMYDIASFYIDKREVDTYVMHSEGTDFLKKWAPVVEFLRKRDESADHNKMLVNEEQAHFEREEAIRQKEAQRKKDRDLIIKIL